MDDRRPIVGVFESEDIESEAHKNVASSPGIYSALNEPTSISASWRLIASARQVPPISLVVYPSDWLNTENGIDLFLARFRLLCQKHIAAALPGRCFIL